ncbi:MAG: hypothetical protein JJ971_14755 [Balneolaceae bacterium]|nr:hypothetical protein [Balneolaceae bacterium]MBO6547658.1 hypothetical protein [Balneolaceae bacterium]MBO6648169.1 hypothetical protein [Balneolaceae bacterium]
MTNNGVEAKNKSRMGLGFLAGMIGAYIFSDGLVRVAYWLGIYELGTTTNIGYLVSIFTGLVTGFLTVIISKQRQLRILLFVVGTLLVMDNIAFFSNSNFSLARMINRMMIDFSLLIGGLLTYFLVIKVRVK